MFEATPIVRDFFMTSPQSYFNQRGHDSRISNKQGSKHHVTKSNQIEFHPCIIVDVEQKSPEIMNESKPTCGMSHGLYLEKSRGSPSRIAWVMSSLLVMYTIHIDGAYKL